MQGRSEVAAAALPGRSTAGARNHRDVRLSASPLGTVTPIEAIVHQDHRRSSNGATGGARPSLLPDAYSGHAGAVAASFATRKRSRPGHERRIGSLQTERISA